MTDGGEGTSGWICTDETQAILSAKRKGVKKSPEHCAHISAGQRYDSPYKNLIAEMDKQKLSYSALAKLLEVAHQNISRKMLGQRNFTAKDKAKLVEIFNKPIEYLLYKEEF